MIRSTLIGSIGDSENEELKTELSPYFNFERNPAGRHLSSRQSRAGSASASPTQHVRLHHSVRQSEESVASFGSGFSRLNHGKCLQSELLPTGPTSKRTPAADSECQTGLDSRRRVAVARDRTRLSPSFDVEGDRGVISDPRRGMLARLAFATEVSVMGFCFTGTGASVLAAY